MSVRSVSVMISIKLISIKGPMISISKIIAWGFEVRDKTRRSAVEPITRGTKMGAVVDSCYGGIDFSV